MEDAAQEASSGMEEGVDGLMAEEETSVVVAVTLEEVILVEVSSVEVVEMAAAEEERWVVGVVEAAEVE